MFVMGVLPSMYASAIWCERVNTSVCGLMGKNEDVRRIICSAVGGKGKRSMTLEMLKEKLERYLESRDDEMTTIEENEDEQLDTKLKVEFEEEDDDDDDDDDEEEADSQTQQYTPSEISSLSSS